MRAIIQQLPVACVIKDTALRYQLVNDKYCKMMQLSADELIGRTSHEIYGPEIANEYEATEQRVRDSGVPAELSQTIAMRDGSERQYITRVTRIEGPGKAHFICITLSNVTALTAARQQAESADRLKSEFLATMSHELRTPLNGVLGLAEILKLEDLSPEQAHIVDLIVSSGQTLISVISDILDMTMIEAGHIKLVSKPYSVEMLVEEIAGLMTPIANAAGLTLFLSSSPSPPLYGIGDEARIKQILANFVNNAIKFTESGHVEIHFGGDSASDELRLSVIDTGVGLKPEEQQAIFERFRQVDNTSSRPRQGVGLGLSICRSLAELMGGTITVASESGQGTTFTLSLPLNMGKNTTSEAKFYPLIPVEVLDPKQHRARGWISRLEAMGYEVTISDNRPRVKIISYDPCDLTNDKLAELERDIAAGRLPHTPAILSFPQDRTDARTRISRAAEDQNIICLSRPVSGADLRASLTRLAPALRETAEDQPNPQGRAVSGNQS
ncbi:MAG: ATP-binding protein [Pseudomonadota bacterium]